MKFSWIYTLLFVIFVALGAAWLLIRMDVVTSAGRIIGLTFLLTAIVLIVFYVNIMKPIRSINNGVDLLKAQDFSSRLAHVHQAEADRIIDMFNRMMASLKAERLRMREQNHFLDLLIDVSPMGIIILDSHDRIASVNPSASTFLDETAGELVGQRLGDTPTQLRQTLKSLQLGETATVRLSDSMIYRCSRLSFMDRGFAHHFILLEKLTDEVIKAEKKSYEKVIRVIAHEVNNTMAGVNSMLSTAEGILDTHAEENADILEVIGVCEGRCRAMSKFITAYADVVKIPDPSLIITDLNVELERWRIMLESLCSGRNIRLNFDLSPQEIEVRLDPVLMEQVMINIVKNSAESIGENGEITISTTSVPPTLTVTDNGQGIDENTSGMLFSPFFSTKVNGHGIGLLFVSEVLHKHGFRFSLTTAPDRLTRFRISLARH